MKKIISAIYLTTLLPFLAHAQSSGFTQPPNTTLPNPLKTNKTLIQVINAIAGFLLEASILIGTVMIIYAAFLIITSAGSEDKVSQGKRIILYVVIGLGVMLLFKVIIAIVGQIVGVQL